MTMNMPSSPLLVVADDQRKSGPWYCDQLERGKVLFFPGVPFDFPDADRDFLLSQKQSGSRFHKNISYRPGVDVLKGVSPDSPDRERLQAVMRHFSQQVTSFVSSFLSPYSGKLKLDFA
ncbi:MAG TPA: Kdo hydroxylase family protein, partial [Candidatus Angelobacter sp.]|nr:Kdo hydroxylase family protein [Candidatus Angelobacter sp.]